MDRQYGSISGQVTFAGGNTAVNLASVVALPAAGPAVSALTDPAGFYNISGLPVGTYMLYVHPLPPDAVPTYSREGSSCRTTPTGSRSIPALIFKPSFIPAPLT